MKHQCPFCYMHSKCICDGTGKRPMQPVLVTGHHTGMEYWVVDYEDGTFGWFYEYKGYIYGFDDFDSFKDAEASIDERELHLSNGDTVMV